MKKIIAMIIAAAMIMSLAAIPVFAEEAASAVFTIEDVTAAPGEEVTVALTVSGDYEVHGWRLEVNYDVNKLTAIDSQPGDVLSVTGILPIINHEKIPGTVAIGGMAPTDPLSGSGVFCTITFKLADDLEDGEKIPLSIDVYEFFYRPVGEPASTPVSYETHNGTINVSTGSIETQAPVTDEPVDPSDEPVNPSDEPVNPSDEPVNPSDEPVNPSDEPVNPSDEPVNPSDEPAEPTDKPDDPDVPSTGAMSLIGIGVVAALAGTGAVLFKKKED